MTLPGRKKQVPSGFRKVLALAVLVLLVLLVENGRDGDLRGSPVLLEETTSASRQCLDLQLSQHVGERYVPNPDTEAEKCLLYTEPNHLVNVIMTMALGTPNQGRCDYASDSCSKTLPYDATLRQYGNDWPPFGYTMVGRARLENFRAAIEEVNRNGIQGAIAELGVWRGGAMMVAAAVVKESMVPRDLYLFDAFNAIEGYNRHAEFLENSEETVRSHFDLFDLNGPNVKFVPGLFKDTLPSWRKGTPLAVLRIDGNFYDSYQDALYYMFEDVPVGGFIIFDDVFSHPPVMQCWKDFQSDQGLNYELQRIDRHSAWFRKTAAVTLDQSKKHPPQDVNK